MSNADGLPTALLDFWCHAHGYVLRSASEGIAVIDHGFGDTVWMAEDLAGAVQRSLRIAEDAAALRRLSPSTYEIRHNPNCPSRYEVRTTGRDGIIDHKPPGRTLNDVGYGTTLADAVAEMERTANPSYIHPSRATHGAPPWHS